MSLGDVKDAAQLAVALIAIVAAVGGPLWMQRVVRELSALRQLADAQLTPDSGRTLIDKVDAVHAAIFSAGNESIPETIRQIRADQLKRVSENDARHGENVRRLDRLEEHHAETSQKLDRLELRQELGARVIALMVPGIAPNAQEEVRRVIQEDPEVRRMIAEMQAPQGEPQP